MFTCKEIAKLLNADSVLLQEMPWLKRFELRAHLSLCRRCSGYAKQLKALSGIVDKIVPEEVSNAESRIERRVVDELLR